MKRTGALLTVMLFSVMAASCTREPSASVSAVAITQNTMAQPAPKEANGAVSEMQQARLEWMKKPFSRTESAESFGPESGE